MWSENIWTWHFIESYSSEQGCIYSNPCIFTTGDDWIPVCMFTISWWWTTWFYRPPQTSLAISPSLYKKVWKSPVSWITCLWTHSYSTEDEPFGFLFLTSGKQQLLRLNWFNCVFLTTSAEQRNNGGDLYFTMLIYLMGSTRTSKHCDMYWPYIVYSVIHCISLMQFSQWAVPSEEKWIHVV